METPFKNIFIPLALLCTQSRFCKANKLSLLTKPISREYKNTISMDNIIYINHIPVAKYSQGI